MKLCVYLVAACVRLEVIVERQTQESIKRTFSFFCHGKSLIFMYENVENIHYFNEFVKFSFRSKSDKGDSQEISVKVKYCTETKVGRRSKKYLKIVI